MTVPGMIEPREAETSPGLLDQHHGRLSGFIERRKPDVTSMPDPRAALYREATRAVALGYPVAMVRLSWDVGRGKKQLDRNPGKHWHLQSSPDAEQIEALIKSGCNAFLMRTIDLGVAVRDADSPEAIARIRGFAPRHVVETPRGGLHAYYRGPRTQSATEGEDTMMAQVYGPGSFYERNGETVVYRGTVPDPAELDPLPAPMLAEVVVERQRAVVGARQLKAQSAAAREFERLRERLFATLTAGKQGLWSHDDLRDCASHLIKLCGSEVGRAQWDAAFDAVGLSQDDADALKIDSAIDKYGPVADDVRPDDQLPDEVRFWAGGRHAEMVTEVASGPATANLPPEFWNARASLKHVQTAAHARRLPADAVLGAVLARVASMVPPTARIDTGVGVPASLNLFVALLGSSGVGKSTSARLADTLFRTDAMVPASESSLFATARPIGSGEGMADEYLGTVEDIDPRSGQLVKQRMQVKAHAMFYADEGASLLESGSRPGSTLLPTIRTAWTGAAFGQKNASADRDRYVDKYAMGMWIGIQPSHAARLLTAQSVDEGTLQRFVWLSTIDPLLPNEPAPDPGPLKFDVADLGATVIGDLIAFPESLKWELGLAAAARVRGDVQVAEGREHDVLQRVKLAGCLALLDGRHEVTLSDWALAGMVVDTSAALVDQVRHYVAQRRRLEATDRTEGLVQRELRVAQAKQEQQVQLAEQVRSWVITRVHDCPGELRSWYRAAARSDRRSLVYDELDGLVADGALRIEQGRVHPA